MAFQIGSLKVEPRYALMPLSMLAILIAYFIFHVPAWGIAIFCLWIPLYYLVYPWFLRRKWDIFERTFGMMFQRGSYDELLNYYQNQWFLRKFAPQGEMLGKLGLIYIALNKYREAERVLEQAIRLQPARARDRIYVNLGNVKYELGKYGEAKQAYSKVSQASPYHRAVELSMTLVDARVEGLGPKQRRDLEQKREVTTGNLREKIDSVLQEVA